LLAGLLVRLEASKFLVSNFSGEAFEVAVKGKCGKTLVCGASLGTTLATKFFLFELIDATVHSIDTFRALDLLKLQVKGGNPLHEVEPTEWVGTGGWVAGNRVPTIANVEQLRATQGRRKGDIMWSVEIEVGRKAILGSNINVRSRLVGLVEAGLPLLRVQEILGGNTQDRQEVVGRTAVDDAAANGLGKLREGGVDRVHGFKWRQVEFEALAARTGLGHAKAASAITKVVDTVALSFDGEGLAGAAGVVNMRASVGHKFSVNEKGPCRETRTLTFRFEVRIQESKKNREENGGDSRNGKARSD